MKEKILIIGIAFFSGIAGAYTFQFFNRPATQGFSLQSEQINPVQVTNRPVNIPENFDFINASLTSTPTVVYIKTASTQYGQASFFDLFFGNSSQQQVVSSGSGVIFSPDGYIVTNNHVIDNASSIEVIHNKRTYKAKLIGTDPSNDIAVLKIEAQKLPSAKIAKSKDVKIGEWVLAVGNPFNLTSTVTAGIVSAKDRNINIVNTQFPIESFIQTDAAINPGNSGGALVNVKGELIGINTAILSRTGSYTGYGFAVPIDIVSKVVADLIKYGEVQTGFLGVDVADIDNQTAAQYNLADFSGVVVTYIDANGVAQKAGLKKGDVITAVNNEAIDNKGAFDEQISFYRPGDRIKIDYKRGAQVFQAQVTLTNREGTTGVLKREVYTVEGLGADLESLSKIERDRLKINNGVRVNKLKTGLIANMGIEEGFIIRAINKKPVNSPKDVTDILQSVRGRIIIEGIDKRGTEGYYQSYF